MRVQVRNITEVETSKEQANRDDVGGFLTEPSRTQLWLLKSLERTAYDRAEHVSIAIEPVLQRERLRTLIQTAYLRQLRTTFWPREG